MQEKNKDTNKVLTIILALLIIISVLIVIYINIPKVDNTTPTHEKSKILLSLIYNKQEKNLTLEDLQNMEVYTGYGGYKTKYPAIKGPFECTGVNITHLLKQIVNIPTNYTLKVTANDGWVTNYTIDEINGNVTIYDKSGNETNFGNVTMLLVFAEDGEYNFNEGPLKIAYVNNNEPYTDSFLWSKYVIKMEIIS